MAIENSNTINCWRFTFIISHYLSQFLQRPQTNLNLIHILLNDNEKIHL